MAGEALPLRNGYLPDSARTPEALALQAQENFEDLAIAIGNGSVTAGQAMTGLYSGPWGPFTAVAGYTPRYSRTNGLVVLEGAVTTSGLFPASPETMFTLPDGFRPAGNNVFSQIALGGTTGTTSGVVVVNVLNSGVVQFTGGLTGGGLTNNMYYVSLGGIVFRAA